MQELTNRIAILQKIAFKWDKEKNTIISKHLEWERVKDIRLTIFNKCCHIFNSTLLSLNHEKSMFLKDFWEINCGLRDTSQIEMHVRQYDNYIKQALIFCFFSSIESSIRILNRALDPNEYNHSTDSFRNIYNSFLIKLNLVGYKELLAFFSTIRNIQHNNGVYYDRSLSDSNIKFKGNEYKLKIGKTVNFISWELLFEIFEDLLNLCIEIVNNPVIESLSEIKDPFNALA